MKDKQTKIIEELESMEGACNRDTDIPCIWGNYSGNYGDVIVPMNYYIVTYFGHTPEDYNHKHKCAILRITHYNHPKNRKSTDTKEGYNFTDYYYFKCMSSANKAATLARMFGVKKLKKLLNVLEAK